MPTTKGVHPDLISALLWVLALATALSGGETTTQLQTERIHKLQSLLAKTVAADPTIPGVIAHVRMPGLDLTWSGAAGLVAFDSDTPLTPRHPVRLASNTKPYVAAAILRLWEDGRIDLTSTLRDHLSLEYLQLLANDGYDPAAITLNHLLSHTAGLFDYATSQLYTQQVLDNPRRGWSRLDQVRGAVAWGNPIGAPGAAFHYADTGYILLGQILEQQTGRHLGAALRRLIDYRRLGLEHTWLETLEPPPPDIPERTHQYYGDIDIHSFDPSFDLYGGGGLVATMEDLAIFMRALGTGTVFKKATTLNTMLDLNAPADSGLKRLPNTYRLGISISQIGADQAYTHEGFWGTAAAYLPALDAAIAISLNQGRTDRRWPLMESIVETLGQAAKSANLNTTH
ncbi:MAG: serine hydrolase [Candidatus Latescibacteria bacterium]|nr:serine hydrolase [Candidatus Latescibacterota bacterium]